MSAVSVRNSHGRMVRMESVSATVAKNSFSAILDKAVAGGIVAITKRDKPRAVVLSMDEYQALQSRAANPLGELHSEFDALFGTMQRPSARAAGSKLFSASSAKLGKAALRTTVSGTRKRG
jgi:prevent-host-death family protein